MVKYVGMLLVFVIATFIAGCSKPNESNAEEGLPVLITLTCNPNLALEPCQDVVFDRSDEIRIMMEAIHKAERMPGIIDYGTQYKMSITNADSSITRYDFSLGMDPKMQGLLVNEEDTHTGYSIPLEDANQLRRLIQRRID
ncbi:MULTISPECIES: hypothetical protein [Paenibacillus]|uniref:YhfM-like domain-containing protein n=1 Tax=Paenibacillus amylolyticus TaxID=1451 RepID=A0ABD8AXN8_PAEAM|nr:hypothetical protein [Paenibacillus sp. FSL H7-689]ETT51497.1 hypothetical protein C170_13920 [Paenibacillus sp. FSL H7-689]